MPSVEFREVEFGFGTQSLFRDASFRFESPSVVAVLGRSGSGKSSLLKLIAGVHAPRSGQIVKDTRRIAWVPQDSGLFPWLTVRENMLFPTTLANRRQDRIVDTVEEIGRDLGISDVLDSYPGSVSGGQLQRGAIGRALMGGADILILDEPFSSLDAPTRTDLRRLIRGLAYKRGQVVFLATHDLMDAAYISESVVILENSALKLLSLEPCEAGEERIHTDAANIVADFTQKMGRGVQ